MFAGRGAGGQAARGWGLGWPIDRPESASKNCRLDASSASSTRWLGAILLRAATLAVHSDLPAVSGSAPSSPLAAAVSPSAACLTGGASIQIGRAHV